MGAAATLSKLGDLARFVAKCCELTQKIFDCHVSIAHGGSHFIAAASSMTRRYEECKTDHKGTIA